MTHDLTYQEIVDRLRDHAEQIAFDMLVDAKARGNEVEGECDGKCSVVIKGQKTGVVGFWSGQNRGRTGGNLISLIEIAKGCESHGEAVRWAKKEYLGIEDREMTPDEKRRWAEQRQVSEMKAAGRRIEAQKQTEAKKETVREFWHEAKPITGTPAQAYLEQRVSHLPSKVFSALPSLRYHPRMFCGPLSRECGALIGGVQGPDKALIALWRIFVTPEGKNVVVDEKKVKLGFGPASGGAVRLGPVTETLLLCEGIETGLGVMMLNGGLNGSKSVWPCLSTSGLIGFEIPEGVKRLEIWCDGDRHKFKKRADGILPPPGLDAAEKLKARVSGQVDVSILEPPAGSDWLDIWNSSQEDDYGDRAVQYRND